MEKLIGKMDLGSRAKVLNRLLYTKTIKQYIESFGRKAYCGNRSSFDKIINKYNLRRELDLLKEETVKIGTRRIIEANPYKPKDWNNIFCDDSTVSRTSVKKLILRENIIEYKCSCCGNTGEWSNAPLVLQLDHINGKNNDNRLENLRFLCPNCHSQTDTFAGKRFKMRGTCIDCGKSIFVTSTRCSSCFGKKRKHEYVIPVAKEDLFALLKEMPFTKVGEMYNVSDNAIRKWCLKYEIPNKSSYYRNLKSTF